MENEELFGLMEKMYNEIQNGFLKVNDRLDKLENGQLKLEKKLEEIRKTLYDGFILNSETIHKLNKKVDELSGKVDKHDIKIQVIDGGKKAL